MSKCIEGLIPQSLQLEVTMANLCLCHMSEESRKACVRRSMCFCIRAFVMPVLVGLRCSCSHVTEVWEP